MISGLARAGQRARYLQATFVPYQRDALAFAAKITVAVLIYHGTEDKIAPIARASELLVKALPDAKLVRLDGFGHLPDVEDPSRAIALLREFLAEGK